MFGPGRAGCGLTQPGSTVVCDSQTHVFFIRILLATSVIKVGAGEGFFATVPIQGPASVNAELPGS